jgi:hypothetical protein
MISFENFEGARGRGGFSFADIERLEAERLLKVIRDVEKKLYDGKVASNDLGSDEEVPSTDEELESFRRFANVGYDAHTDGVDDKEINVRSANRHKYP